MILVSNVQERLLHIMNTIRHNRMEADALAVRSGYRFIAEAMRSGNDMEGWYLIYPEWKHPVESFLDYTFEVTEPQEDAPLIGVENYPELEQMQELNDKINETVKH
jgi:hypothetical protein